MNISERRLVYFSTNQNIRSLEDLVESSVLFSVSRSIDILILEVTGSRHWASCCYGMARDSPKRNGLCPNLTLSGITPKFMYCFGWNVCVSCSWFGDVILSKLKLKPLVGSFDRTYLRLNLAVRLGTHTNHASCHPPLTGASDLIYDSTAALACSPSCPFSLHIYHGKPQDLDWLSLCVLHCLWAHFVISFIWITFSKWGEAWGKQIEILVFWEKMDTWIISRWYHVYDNPGTAYGYHKLYGGCAGSAR